MDNRENEKNTVNETLDNNAPLENAVSVTEDPFAYEQLAEEPKKKAKKEKKQKEKKGSENGSGKAIVICLIAAAIVVVLGIVAAGILWYIGSESDDEILPGETEEMPELEDGTKFH